MSLTHVHSTLPSAAFTLDDSVFSQRGWGVYLDDTLDPFEVFVDAPDKRTFVASATWAAFDGVAEDAFRRDFLLAYEGTDTCTLVRIDVADTGPYAKAFVDYASRFGGDVPRGADRLTDLLAQATALTVAVAGINSAPSAQQRQLAMIRHAGLAVELARLEREVEQVRSALSLATCALYDLPA